jgi:F-type H+-transporting ATPase subunit b
MRRILVALPATLLAGAALAQEVAHEAVETHHEYGFVSLRNTDFVVLLAFILFVAICLYYRVPSTVARMLDGRAEGIRKDLSEARALREEAQALLASFERRRGEMDAQAARIVAEAREEALRAADAAKFEAERTVARRLQAAEEQIASAEERALRQVRDRAVAVAVAAAQEVLARQMTPEAQGRLVDSSIDTVAAKLH